LTSDVLFRLSVTTFSEKLAKALPPQGARTGAKTV
jgi:hypothetical protein